MGNHIKGCELAVFEKLRLLGSASSPDLIRSVKESSPFTDIAINKALRNSAFIFVDESQGRRNHVFRLLGEVNSNVDTRADRYQEFQRRLERLTEDGSDVEGDVLRRREQDALRAYLFEDTVSEFCALCGVEYLTGSLVAAHKKKRSNCKEFERSDPHVVMPLCKFGCDHLYEERYAKIVDGHVVSVADINKLKVGERNYLNQIVGRKVNDKWLRGNSRYFD